MIRCKHKIISIVLCAALLLCAYCALCMTANAASGTIYVRIPSSWSSAYCYMWGSDTNGEWPGVPMTPTGESGVYSYAVSGSYTSIIFNNGEKNGVKGVTQTDDMSFSDSYIGQICDVTTIGNPKWSAYTGGTSDPTTPTPSGDYVVYLKNTKGWSTPYCYMWNNDSDKNHEWAGEPMTKVEDDVWMYTASKRYASCIFSGSASGAEQTSDLTANYGQIFDYDAKTWSPYDPATIRISEFGADPLTAVYTGMEISLFATATSSEGAVSYKFSVGSNVIRDWAASGKTTWTPVTAGTFTVTFDFKDTAGNTNQRTLSLTVQSGENVSNPIIKKVTPNAYVQTGANNTIAVTAGGGKTGTNLLFYKFVIKDSAGKQINTAYYTLNSNYTFKPTANGTYTVEVTVQASDNSEAKRTLTLTASGTIPTEPTDPIVTTGTEPTNPPVGDYQLGDANKDKLVDIKDATYLLFALIETDGYEIDKAVCDMDQNGRVDVNDVTAIQRYLVNMV